MCANFLVFLAALYDKMSDEVRLIAWLMLKTKVPCMQGKNNLKCLTETKINAMWIDTQWKHKKYIK